MTTTPVRDVVTYDEVVRPGITVRTVHDRDEGTTAWVVFVGGWRVGEYKTTKGKDRAVQRHHIIRMNDGRTRRVAELGDGDFFSLDSGRTWHTCAVVLWGTVSVYDTEQRGDDAPCRRIAAGHDDLCIVRVP